MPVNACSETHQQSDLLLLYSNTHQHLIHRNVRRHGAVQLESMADWGIIVLINITPCGSLNNYLNENSSLQNVVYITLSFPKKTHYWERKSPQVCTVLIKYDSTLSQYNIILKLNRWSLPVPLIHVKLTQHTVCSDLSQLTDLP